MHTGVIKVIEDQLCYCLYGPLTGLSLSIHQDFKPDWGFSYEINVCTDIPPIPCPSWRIKQFLQRTWLLPRSLGIESCLGPLLCTLPHSGIAGRTHVQNCSNVHSFLNGCGSLSGAQACACEKRGRAVTVWSCNYASGWSCPGYLAWGISVWLICPLLCTLHYEYVVLLKHRSFKIEVWDEPVVLQKQLV